MCSSFRISIILTRALNLYITKITGNPNYNVMYTGTENGYFVLTVTEGAKEY